jgi:hypothetical protein
LNIGCLLAMEKIIWLMTRNFNIYSKVPSAQTRHPKAKKHNKQPKLQTYLKLSGFSFESRLPKAKKRLYYTCTNLYIFLKMYIYIIYIYKDKDKSTQINSWTFR